MPTGLALFNISMHLAVKPSVMDIPVFLSFSLFSLYLQLYRTNLIMIGLGFFLFCFDFRTLWLCSISTSVSPSSKCSSIAFKAILSVLSTCSWGIPWTKRVLLLEYCSWISTSDFNCSMLLLKEDPLSTSHFQLYFSHSHSIFLSWYW